MTVITRLPSRFIRIGISWSRDNLLPWTCICKVRKWLGNYLYFSKATMCIRGLVFSHGFVNHGIVSILIMYLTYNWKHSHFQLAAVVTNVQEGVSDIMVIVLSHISYIYKGPFKLIVITNAAYLLGLLLLWISAGYMSADAAARVYYGAAILLAFGEAGRSATFREFLDDQYFSELKHTTCTNEKRLETRKEALWDHPWFLGALAALLLMFFDWRDSFMISAIVMGVSYLLFLLGYSHYYFVTSRNPKKTEWKSRLEYSEKLPILSCPINEQEQSVELCIVPKVEQLCTNTERRLCSAEEATRGNFWTLIKLKEENRFFVQVLVMWSAFLIYSLVESAGSTFFFEQMDNLDDSIGSFEVSATYFTVLSSFSSSIISNLYDSIVQNKWKHKRLVKIGCGLACSMLCCIAAWQVEIHRLNEIKSKGVGNNTSRTIPMSICWLVPQFLILGLMRGLAQGELIDFYNDRVANDDKLRSRYYAAHINDFVMGVGKLITAISVLIFRRSWFNDSINWSRLDHYYIVLTFLSLVNIIYYVCISCYFYGNDKSRKYGNKDNEEISALVKDALRSNADESNEDLENEESTMDEEDRSATRER